jgi:hypothetical protein
LNNSARSTFINPLDLNIEDTKIVNIINTSRQFKNESNLSQIDTTINPHERNILSINNTALVNATNDNLLVNENSDTINKFELNIDTKSESFLSNTTHTSNKPNQFDFLDVKKVMSIVKSLPIDMILLKSISLPKSEAKRESSVIDLTNTNDTKRFKSDQSIAFNNLTNSNNSRINNSYSHQTFDTKPVGEYPAFDFSNKSTDLINHMYNCNYVQSNGVKCNFATPYISYYKKHLKNKGHTEQENVSQADVLVNPQNLQSSYYTSILSGSNSYQKNVQPSQNSSKSNRNNYSKNNNYGSRSSYQQQAKGSGNYYSAQKNGKN